MLMDNLLKDIKKDFPEINIKFKNKSLFMKIVDKILFFNKDFMSSFTTTIGSNIYFPSEEYVKNSPITAIVILLHEIVHIYDSNKTNKFLFGFLYLFPQILALLAIPLFFVSWKIAIFFLLFLLPFPAYFRMKAEKRAYASSLYVIHQLSLKKNFKIELNKQKENYISYFKKNDYYFMWLFSSIDTNFDEYLIKIENGQKPFEDDFFVLLDKYIDIAAK